MAWNDKIFRDRIAARAAEIGKSQTQILAEAGLAKSWLSAGNGRAIRTVEKIVGPLEWSLNDLFQALSASLGWNFDESAGQWVSNKEFDEAIAALQRSTDSLKESIEEAERRTNDLQFRLDVANGALRYMKEVVPPQVGDLIDRTLKISSNPAPRGETFTTRWNVQMDDPANCVNTGSPKN